MPKPVERGGKKAYTAFVDFQNEARGAHILIVEDDRAIAELVATYLGRDGAIVELASSAEEAENRVALASPDLVLLDLGLPGANGFEFLRRFREKSIAPVIIVSARESDEDKLEGLGLGADDFVSKPFSPRVLTARVQAQLRRASYAAPEPERLAFGPYVLDFDGRLLERDGERVPLSKREFEVLAFLARAEGKTFGPEELYHAVWGLEHGDLSTVAVHIQRIRRKIEADPQAPRYLRTVPGSGYRFFGGSGRP
jgi:two-component system response regulator RegX3